MSGLTTAIAEFAADPDAIPAARRDEFAAIARDATVDTVAAIIAGSREPATELVRSMVAMPSAGTSTVVGLNQPTSPVAAAEANAYSGHIHDIDDVAEAVRGHPSVVLSPALLAAAEATGASGREYLDGYIIGFEVAAAIGRALPIGPHFLQGWHSTSTIGTIAAAVGCSRLLGLDAGRIRHAIGIAASMSAGSRQSFGTNTKALHAARASSGGLHAALLAAKGFTADPEQLDGAVGFLHLFGFTPDAQHGRAELGTEWAIASDDGPRFKRWPACGATHRVADAAMRLSTSIAGSPDRVQRIHLRTNRNGFVQLIHHRPVTGLQGKFSAEYVAAASLLDGRLTFATFEDASVMRASIRTLIDVTTVEETDDEVPFATVEIETDSDKFVERTERFPYLPPEDLERKFISCAKYAGMQAVAPSLFRELHGIDRPGPLSLRAMGF